MKVEHEFPGRLYIGGEWIATRDREAVINPATEDVFAEAPLGARREAEDAIAAAREAFDKGSWPRLTPQERAAKMGAFLAAIEARKPDILRLIVAEAGATVKTAETVQYATPMAHARYAVEAGSRPRDIAIAPGIAPDLRSGKALVGGVVRREPAGVVAAITPYNFPFYLNLVKVAPALVMGNTMVLKPSPYTPFEALVFGEIADEVGLPKGVLNIVTGGTEVGEILTTDPRVDLISFTGSDAVGSQIMAQAAPTLKRLLFELGGKSALIIRGDADLDRALTAGLGFLTHCGQGCALQTRHIVHNSVRSAYVERLAAAVRAVKIGDPSAADTGLGPLIRGSQRTRVERYVEAGLKSGARLVTGGRKPQDQTRGFFYEATVFDDVDNASSIAQDEIFGPVATVIGFDTDEEAIALANASLFGLSGAVFSGSMSAAFEIAAALRTGGVSINGGGVSPSAGVVPPFGGFKRSGLGRENGEEGLNAYTELKSVTFRVA